MEIFRRPKPQKVVMAPPPPPTPTFDDAAAREEFSRKVKRRRGHAANAIAGGSPSPSVASRVLLG